MTTTRRLASGTSEAPELGEPGETLSEAGTEAAFQELPRRRARWPFAVAIGVMLGAALLIFVLASRETGQPSGRRSGQPRWRTGSPGPGLSRRSRRNR